MNKFVKLFAAAACFFSLYSYAAAAGPAPLQVNIAEPVKIDADLHDIARNKAGAYVAVGDTGTVLLSSDAYRWKQAKLPMSQNLTDIATNGGKFVAVGEGTAILASPDGSRWTKTSISVNWKLRDVISAKYLAKFLKANKAKPDHRVTLQKAEFYDVLWDGKRFIAVGSALTKYKNQEIAWDTFIGTSADGATWNFQPMKAITRTAQPVLHIHKPNAIAKTASGYVMAGDYAMFRSSDLKTWIMDSSIRGEMEDIACGGKTCVAAGWDGRLGIGTEKQRTTGVIYVSTNDRDWKEVKTDKDYHVTDVQWAKKELDFNGYAFVDLNTVVWNGSRFAVGANFGVTFSSSDTKDWIVSSNMTQKSGVSFHPFAYEKYSGLNADIRKLLWDGSKYIAVGNRGTIMTSRDTHDWSLSLPLLPSYKVERNGPELAIRATEGNALNDLMESLKASDLKIKYLRADATVHNQYESFEFSPPYPDYYAQYSEARDTLDKNIDTSVTADFRSYKLTGEQVAEVQKQAKIREIIYEDTSERISAFLQTYSQHLKLK